MSVFLALAKSFHDVVSADAGDTASESLRETNLVARIRAGEEAAFEELFHWHYGALCGFANSYLRNRADAEDVVQGVFRNLWLLRREWVPRGPVGLYLRIATRNGALNVLRSVRNAERSTQRMVQRTGGKAGLAETPTPVEERVVTGDMVAAIYEAVDALPDRCRAVFVLRWREGCSNAEVARRLGIAEKTVEMQLHRALKALRSQFQGRE